MFNFPDQATVKRVVYSLPRVGVGTSYGLPQARYAQLCLRRAMPRFDKWRITFRVCVYISGGFPWPLLASCSSHPTWRSAGSGERSLTLSTSCSSTLLQVKSTLNERWLFYLWTCQWYTCEQKIGQAHKSGWYVQTFLLSHTDISYSLWSFLAV